MLRAILIAVLILVPAASFAGPKSTKIRPQSGAVTYVHPAQGLLALNGAEFLVPAGVYDLSKVDEGDFVEVEITIQAGVRVVQKLEVIEGGD